MAVLNQFAVDFERNLPAVQIDSAFDFVDIDSDSIGLVLMLLDQSFVLSKPPIEHLVQVDC